MRCSVNSVDDFCLFAPPEPGPNSAIGDTEVRAFLAVGIARLT
jgi:hypothetical protein